MSKSPVPFAISLALLCGCNSVKPINPKTTVFDFPRLNEVTERELGDTLIDNGTIITFEAIETTDPVVGHWGLGGKMRAEAGTFIAVGFTGDGIIYRAPAPIHWQAPLGSGLSEGGVIIPHSTTNKPSQNSTGGKHPSRQSATNGPVLFVTIGGQTRRSRPLKDFSFKKTVANVPLPGSFRQQLIYNGRIGDSIKFLYREINDGYLRFPFTQEATYDLKEGDVIGFKGARLKIVEASNTKIKYLVTKSFQPASATAAPAAK